VAVVKPGRILYEMEGMTKDMANHAFRLAQAKLPVMTRIVHRSEETL
jgi:large subunit ribosomal protein L16